MSKSHAWLSKAAFSSISVFVLSYYNYLKDVRKCITIEAKVGTLALCFLIVFLEIIYNL